MSSLPSNNSDGQNNAVVVANIYAEHGSYIKAVIASQVQNKADVEDLYQSFYVSLLRWPIPEDVRHIRSFLYKAIVNDIINFKQRRQRYHSNTRDLLGRTVSEQAQIDPAVKCIQMERLTRVYELIEERIHQRYFQAVEQRYRQDRSSGETAKIMGVSKRTVDSYTSIGLRKLQELMARESGDEHDSS